MLFRFKKGISEDQRFILHTLFKAIFNKENVSDNLWDTDSFCFVSINREQVEICPNNKQWEEWCKNNDDDDIEVVVYVKVGYPLQFNVCRAADFPDMYCAAVKEWENDGARCIKDVGYGPMSFRRRSGGNWEIVETAQITRKVYPIYPIYSNSLDSIKKLFNENILFMDHRSGNPENSVWWPIDLLELAITRNFRYIMREFCSYWRSKTIKELKEEFGLFLVQDLERIFFGIIVHLIHVQII